MSDPTPRPSLRIVVLNDSAETIGTIGKWLEIHGHSVFSARVPEFRRADEDLELFILKDQPHVMVYDVAMPYVANWDFVELIKLWDVAQGMPIVVTTPNRAALLSIIPEATEAIEIVGQPDDLNLLLQTVVQACAAV